MVRTHTNEGLNVAGIVMTLVDNSGNSVRVIWFDDAPKHLLRASGLNALGVPFKQEWKNC